MAENDGQERTEEATPRRRLEARRRGTVARSVDLTGASVLLAVALVAPSALSALGGGMMSALRLGFTNIPNDLSQSSVDRYVWSLLQPALIGAGMLVATAMVVGVATNLAQVGFVLSGEALTPTFEKLNPISGFKRLFSARSSVEGLKAVAKGLVFGYLAYTAIAGQWEDLIGLAWLPPTVAAAKVGATMHGIVLRIAVAWLALSALDYFFQRKQTDKQLRMTRDELKREMKEQEGAPEVKMAQSQRRRKLLRGRLAENVRQADVVVTNPTHFAVAIQYERNKMHAPLVVAKGQDYLALRIREIASETKVPIVPNPPLARALYKQCEVGDFVPRELFQAVAEVLAYVYRTIKKVRG